MKGPPTSPSRFPSRVPPSPRPTFCRVEEAQTWDPFVLWWFYYSTFRVDETDDNRWCLCSVACFGIELGWTCNVGLSITFVKMTPKCSGLLPKSVCEWIDKLVMQWLSFYKPKEGLNMPKISSTLMIIQTYSNLLILIRISKKSNRNFVNIGNSLLIWLKWFV